VLFPLPLTPFEGYYWSDDTREYPTTFLIELGLSGNLDHDAFLAALEQAFVRHPMLDAVIDDRGRVPQWVPCPNLEPAVDWADRSVPISGEGEFIDLKTSRGLRIWVRTGDDSTRVLLQFHHACCDGAGTFFFLQDLFIFYANELAGDGARLPLPELSVERLRDRGIVAPEASLKPSLPALVRDVLVTAWLWAKIVFPKSALLAAPGRERVPKKQPKNGSPPVPANGQQASGEPDSDRGFLSFETRLIPADQAKQLRAISMARDVTFNDLLVRDLLLALQDWNQACAESTSGRLRVTVPVNLRGRNDWNIPAANRLAFAFVAPAPRSFRDRQQLLDNVRTQMDRIKQWKLGLYFLGGLGAVSGLRSVVPWMLKQNRSFATVVLSNLGRVGFRAGFPRRNRRLVFGNVVLERLTGVPPIRPLTRAAIAVVDYGGETTISLRCDPRYFNKKETLALLDTYIRRLSETARRGD